MTPVPLVVFCFACILLKSSSLLVNVVDFGLKFSNPV